MEIRNVFSLLFLLFYRLSNLDAIETLVGSYQMIPTENSTRYVLDKTREPTRKQESEFFTRLKREVENKIENKSSTKINITEDINKLSSNFRTKNNSRNEHNVQLNLSQYNRTYQDWYKKRVHKMDRKIESPKILRYGPFVKVVPKEGHLRLRPLSKLSDDSFEYIDETDERGKPDSDLPYSADKPSKDGESYTSSKSDHYNENNGRGFNRMNAQSYRHNKGNSGHRSDDHQSEHRSDYLIYNKRIPYDSNRLEISYPEKDLQESFQHNKVPESHRSDDFQPDHPEYKRRGPDNRSRPQSLHLADDHSIEDYEEHPKDSLIQRPASNQFMPGRQYLEHRKYIEMNVKQSEESAPFYKEEHGGDDEYVPYLQQMNDKPDDNLSELNKKYGANANKISSNFRGDTRRWWIDTKHRCYVCGPYRELIPEDTSCGTAFKGDKYSNMIPLFAKPCIWEWTTWGIPIRTQDWYYGRWQVNHCVKREVDLHPVYTERSCRRNYSWSWVGDKVYEEQRYTYAAKRLRRVEHMLWGQEDTCVTTPVASLTPFNYDVSLFARYTVCVCKGKYCNGAPSLTSVRTLASALTFAVLLILPL